LKKLGIGLAVVLVLSLGAVLIVPGFMDWNEYKDRIETAASSMTGREVRIAGDISLSLFPSTALSAKDVTVANIEGGRAPHFLSLKALDVKVALFPLLGGNLKVKKFVLVEPVIALEVLEDGRVNWDFADPAQAAEDQGEDEGTGGRELSLDTFQISNGMISFEDFQSGRAELVRNIHADISMDSLQGPFVVEGQAKYKSLPLGVTLETGTYRAGRKMPLSLDLTAFGDQVTAHFMGGVLPDPETGQVDGKLSLKARDVADLVKIAAVMSENPFAVQQDFQQSFTLSAGFAATPQNITLSDLALSFGDSRGQGTFSATLGDKLKFSGDLSLSSFDLDPVLKFINESKENAASSAASAKADPVDYGFLERLEGEMAFKLGALKYNNKIASQIVLNMDVKDGKLSIGEFRISMPGGSDLTYGGVISIPKDRPEMTGELSLRSGNLRGLLDWLNIDTSQVPPGRLTRFSLEGQVNANDSLVQIYGVKGLLDTAKFSGGISYALQDRLALGIDLQLDNISFDSYMPAAKDKNAGPVDIRDAVKGLADIDANYVLTLKNATFNGAKIVEANLSGSLVGGQLKADSLVLKDMAGLNLEGTAWGGGFDKEPTLTLNLKASARDLGRVQRAFKLENGVNWKALGTFSASGVVKARLDQVDVDLDSQLGSSKMRIKGMVRSATLKQLPEIGSYNLIISAENPSLSVAISQFDLPLTPPATADDRPVALSARIKGIQKQLDVDGNVQIAGGRVAFIGRVQQPQETPSYDLSLELKSPELREFVRGLGLDYKPQQPKLGALQVKSQISGTNNNYVLQNIAGDIGPVKISGSGKIHLPRDKQGKTRFDFTLKAGDIPLSQFMAASADGTAKASHRSFGQWSREPIDLGPLQAYEGQAKISASSLRYKDYIFESPQFMFLVRDGELRVENFTGKLFGGDVKLAGRLSGTSEARMALDISLSKASLAKATKAAGGIMPLSGYLDLNGTFSGEGISQHAIMSSLTGGGKVVASPGLIHGIDIPMISKKLSDVKTSQNFLQVLGTALGGGQTPYKGGTSTITVKNGLINFSPLDLELEGATSAITMGINLFRWEMDLDGRFSLTDHPSAPPIGLKVNGPIHKPVVKYQTQEIQRFVASRIASNMLQNMVGGNETLKGIFGIKEGTKEGTENGGAVSPPPAEPQSESESPEVAPREEGAPQKPEDFGKRLLEKLFKKPAQDQNAAPDTPQ